MNEILKVARTLSSIQRYSHTRLLNPESVLEHCGFVALISYYICERLDQVGEEIDPGKAVLKSIVHDIDETITGDIPRPTKYYSEDITESLGRLSQEAVCTIAVKVDLPVLMGDWEYAKAGKEGAVVSLSDIIAVVNKVWQETVEFGNKSLVGHVGPTREIFIKRIIGLRDQITTAKGRTVIREIELDIGDLLHEIERG